MLLFVVNSQYKLLKLRVIKINNKNFTYGKKITSVKLCPKKVRVGYCIVDTDTGVSMLFSQPQSVVF